MMPLEDDLFDAVQVSVSNARIRRVQKVIKALAKVDELQLSGSALKRYCDSLDAQIEAARQLKTALEDFEEQTSEAAKSADE